MITKTELSRSQFFTMSTCGEACWEAREEVCHCSCHGKNHGILKHGSRPKRTCKIDGYWYELHMITDFPTAKKECQSLREADALVNPHDYPNPYGSGPMVYYDSKAGDSFHCKALTKSQQAWQEVQAANVEGYIYLVWKRIPAPTATEPTEREIVEQAVIDNTSQERAEAIAERFQEAHNRVQELKAAIKQTTTQPAEYPMIEGEGAPQYTFALDTTTEPVQLALL